MQGGVACGPGVAAKETESDSQWRRRFNATAQQPRRFRDLPNWQQYPFPFIDGHYDNSLYPVAEWREASRLALGFRSGRFHLFFSNQSARHGRAESQR